MSTLRSFKWAVATVAVALLLGPATGCDQSDEAILAQLGPDISQTATAGAADSQVPKEAQRGGWFWHGPPRK